VPEVAGLWLQMHRRHVGASPVVSVTPPATPVVPPARRAVTGPVESRILGLGEVAPVNTEGPGRGPGAAAGAGAGRAGRCGRAGQVREGLGAAGQLGLQLADPRCRLSGCRLGRVGVERGGAAGGGVPAAGVQAGAGEGRGVPGPQSAANRAVVPVNAAVAAHSTGDAEVGGRGEGGVGGAAGRGTLRGVVQVQ